MKSEVVETRQGLSLDRIFHPTDFSDTSVCALVHALKLAVETSAVLHVFHATPGGDPVDWKTYPRVEEILERWAGQSLSGVPDEKRDPVDGPDAGLKVERTISTGSNPVVEILEHLQRCPADLIVLATHARKGIERLLSRAVAAPVAREAGGMTLFVPKGARGFVDPATGEVSLRRVLVPISHNPSPQHAVDRLAGFLDTMGGPFVFCTFIHVGAPEAAPRFVLPKRGWTCATLYRQGDVVEEILRAAAENSSDLLVMATEGRQSLKDTISGSTTEQVVRGAPCPVLTVNVG